MSAKMRGVAESAWERAVSIWPEDVGDPNPKHANLLVQLQRPDVTVNGVLTTYLPWQWTYDTNGNLLTQTASLNPATPLTTTFAVNPEGLVTTVTDANTHQVVMAYDASTRNLSRITLPKEPGDPAGPSQRKTDFTYDTYDNLYTVVNALGNTVTIESDADNRPKKIWDPLGFLTEMTYVNGLLTKIERPENQASGANRRDTYFAYDSANRVVAVQQDNAPATPITRVQYGYTGFSDLSKRCAWHVMFKI